MVLVMTESCWSQQLYDSLIVHYSFAKGQALDESGNGLDGFVYATPCADRFGSPNSAMYFNGIDEYIEFPNNNSLKPQYPILFAIWINFESTLPSKICVISNDYVEDAFPEYL
ncbi:MAG: hypothetical protein Kow0068_11710 [Marinilabiliales bacterium]